MSNVKEVSPLASPEESDAALQSQMIVLGSMSALEFELVEDDTKSLRFGKALITNEMLMPPYEKMIVNTDLVRVPGDEVILKPQPDECDRVRSQNINPNIRTFCSLHEMHTHFRNKMVNGKKVIYNFGCSSFKPVHVAQRFFF